MYIETQNLVKFTDDVHILVNGAIDKPEVSLLFFSLWCLFLERNLPLCFVNLTNGSDYHKDFIHIIMNDWA